MADKELENQLIEVGTQLRHPPTAAEDLLSLLETVESILAKVEQSPSDVIASSLKLSQDALTGSEFLGQTNVDVKVAVASCISEITRITAPDAPYDDELMKEVFCLIVASFEGLSDTCSRSFSRRLSILETVAKVRSCVVMLDLECDDLILKMFQCFFKTIRENHPPQVFVSMETIMSLVIGESEDIPSELLYCLLSSVKKEKQAVNPIAYHLGEKVFDSCAEKIRPYLLEEIKSKRMALGGYGKIVATLCQEATAGAELDGQDASDHQLPFQVDEGTLSENAGTSEHNRVTDMAESGDTAVAEPAIERASVPIMSNGIISSEKDHVVSPTQTEEPSQLANNAGDLVPDVKQLEPKRGSRINRRNKKANAANEVQCVDTSSLESQKGTEAQVAHKESTSKDEISSEGLVDSIVESPNHQPKLESSNLDQDMKVVSPTGMHNETGSSTSVQSLGKEQHDFPVRFKRGRPLGKKKISDLNVDGKKADVSNELKESMAEEETVEHAKEADVEAKPEEPDNALEMESPVDDGNGVPANRSECESEPFPLTSPKSSRSKLDKRPKQQKGPLHSEKQQLSGGSTKKKQASDKASAKLSSEKSSVTGASQTKSKRKQASPEKQKAVQYDETLVGSRVKVWWPDDEEFYKGIIDSYNPVDKKHKVLYDDGDEERLHLKDEIWELVDEHDEDGTDNRERMNTLVESDRKKKVKKSPGSSTAKGKSGGSSKRLTTQSTGKPNSSGGKYTAKVETRIANKSGPRNDVSTSAGPKSKDALNSKVKDHSSASENKGSNKHKDEIGAGGKGDLLKAGNKGVTPRSSSKSSPSGTLAKGKSASKMPKGDEPLKDSLDAVDASESDTKSGKKRQRKA